MIPDKLKDLIIETVKESIPKNDWTNIIVKAQ